MKKTITLQQLESGYMRIEVDRAWCQIPRGFCGTEIPDEFIFQPEWNRNRINSAWKFLLEAIGISTPDDLKIREMVGELP